jgi:predicted DNA-binding transcriptional regulator YafY
MVQSSNFITRTKTRQLIEKITSLASIYEAQTLNRTVYVRNRVKAMNESVYNNVDKISEAINNDGVISFQYFTYNLQKKKELRHNGKIHIVSPFALIWVDQNYYLLGYNHEYRELRPFRVDRMTRISLQDGPRLGKEDFEKIDIAMFTTKVFHMYTGEVKLIRMRFMKYLADAVIDRFGEEVMLIPDGEDAFTVTTEVAVSPQFYGWLSGFGSSAEILAPQDVREGMAKHTRSILNLYS